MSTGATRQPAFERIARQDRKGRYAIGLDPGTHTGIAVHDRQEQKLIECWTADFWTAYWHLINTYQVFDAELFVELSKGIGMYWRNRREAAGSPVILQSKAKMMGSVIRESELLIQGLEHVGFIVNVCKPTREKKWNDEYFCRLTGWQRRTTNEHARDAARLCFGR